MERVAHTNGLLSLPDRIPPQAIDAEQSVLGAALISRSAIDRLVDILRGQDFYTEAHRKIWSVVVYLWERDLPVDVLSVPEELRKRGQLEQVGGISYITNLENSVPHAAHAEFYGQVVQDKSILRDLIHQAGDIIARSYDQGDELEALLDLAERQICGVRRHRDSAGLVAASEGVKAAIIQIAGMATGEETGQKVRTGNGAFDRVTGGLDRGDLVIVAGRPSMGKTCLANQWAYQIAEMGQQTAIFSMEMRSVKLYQRFAAMLTGITLKAITTGAGMSEERLGQVIMALSNLAEVPLFIDESAQITLETVRSRCRRLAGKGQLGLIVVDYLQLMDAANPVRGQSRHEELGRITRGFKNLARELDVPVVVLSQLSKAVDRRDDKRPVLADLRDSGSIEADADVVAFPYRPDYYRAKNAAQLSGGEREPKGDVAEIIIAKSRMGETVTIPMLFEGAYQRFRDVDLNHGDEDAPPEFEQRRFV